MIDQDLLADLQALDTLAGSRIYFDTVPQNVALPAVVLRRTGGERPRTTNNTPLFERSVFEVNVVGPDHPKTYGVALAIRDRLDGFRGLMGATRIRDARCIAFPDHQSEVNGDSTTRLATASYRFMHSEG